MEGKEHNVCSGDCKCAGHGGGTGMCMGYMGHRHHFVRIVICLFILGFVFWVGIALGELKAFIRQNYSDMMPRGGYYMMSPNDGYYPPRVPGMMRGWDYNAGTPSSALQGAAAGAVSSDANKK